MYRSPTGWTLKISKPFAFKRSVYTLGLWAPAALSHSATFQVSLLISEPHLSGLNPLPIAPDIPLGPTSWFNPPLIPFISEHNFSGLNSDTRFNPPLMAFISEPHFFGVEPMPIPINMAYGDSWHQSICSPRNKPWEYKPKPNRFLVHSHCANRNEPKRTKGLLNKWKKTHARLPTCFWLAKPIWMKTYCWWFRNPKANHNHLGWC